MKSRSTPWRWLALALLFSVFATHASAAAPMPPVDLDQRVGFDQSLGARIPPNLRFTDSHGARHTLAEFAQGRPLLLTLGYYRCPNLCGVVLDGIASVASKLALRPGADYEIAFLSIDPHEHPEDAAAAMTRVSSAYPNAALPRWHLLTSDADSIHALASAVGFRYFFDPAIDQYAHAAGAVLLNARPNHAGLQVAQYFFGIGFPPGSLRLALVHASRGELGSLIDQLVLLCCGYDPATGRYSLMIGSVMRVLGIGFVLIAGALLLRLSGKRSVGT